jgi:hypothetical protein
MVSIGPLPSWRRQVGDTTAAQGGRSELDDAERVLLTDVCRLSSEMATSQDWRHGSRDANDAGPHSNVA